MQHVSHNIPKDYNLIFFRLCAINSVLITVVSKITKNIFKHDKYILWNNFLTYHFKIKSPYVQALHILAHDCGTYINKA